MEANETGYEYFNAICAEHKRAASGGQKFAERTATTETIASETRYHKLSADFVQKANYEPPRRILWQDGKVIEL